MVIFASRHGERKNSSFFGSGKMTEVSVAYHTVIFTCRMQEKSVLSFLKHFFRESVSGRWDYDNLLSLMFGIKLNKF
ncbi:MAG: hypothetical protein LUI85_08525 [Bacteroides sp.]|nr:hypothetical protein [Bacteroides sp.]